MSKKLSKIDKAFVGKHTLDDLRLQPWTPERAMKAQSLGLVYPNWGEADREQFARTGVYPGAALDVSIFVYLCTLKKEDVDLATAQEARDFGIKRGFHKTNSRAFWDAYNKFFEVHREEQLSATKPKGEKKTEDDNLPNE